MAETRGRNKKQRPARRVSQRGRPARAAADTDPAHIDVCIARYRALGAPTAVRAKVTAFARLVVAQARPDSVDMARRALSHVAGLATWALRMGMPLEPADLLHPHTIERYIMTIRRRAGARSIRSVVRRIGERVNPQAFPPPPPPLSRLGAAHPYTDAEIAAYLALAAAQPTPLRRMRLTAVICLAAGAGLTGPDMLPLRGTDLQLQNSGVMIVTVGGRCPRVIPISPAFHGPLMEVLTWAGNGRLFSSDSPRFIGNCTARVAGGGDLPPLSLRRLRNTWIAARLHDMGFPELLAAAGLTRSPTFFDLAALQPAPSIQQIIGALGRRPPCS